MNIAGEGILFLALGASCTLNLLQKCVRKYFQKYIKIYYKDSNYIFNKFLKLCQKSLVVRVGVLVFKTCCL